MPLVNFVDFDEVFPSQVLDWSHTESETLIFKNVFYNAKYHCHPYYTSKSFDLKYIKRRETILG